MGLAPRDPPPAAAHGAGLIDNTFYFIETPFFFLFFGIRRQPQPAMGAMVVAPASPVEVTFLGERHPSWSFFCIKRPQTVQS
jgi:hypothetical protein